MPAPYAALLVLFCSLLAAPNPSASLVPVNEVSNRVLRSWVLLGQFPNAAVTQGRGEDGATRQGLGQDFLASLGGEANAVLTEQTTVPYTDAQGKSALARAVRWEAEGALVDFIKALKGEDARVAYAYCHLHSPRAQKVGVRFGSDDSAKVWINGRLVHKIWTEGRGVRPGEDTFSAELKAGPNTLLVKVENNWGGWGFHLEVLDAKSAAAATALSRQREAVSLLQDAELRPRGKYEFLFRPGPFPQLEFKEAARLESLAGKMTLSVRWFDSECREVKVAEKPGRYGAYAEARTTNGLLIRRALTFNCAPRGWTPWWDRHQARLERFPNAPIDPLVFEAHRDVVATWAGSWFVERLSCEPDGAVLLAHLSEARPAGRIPNERDPWAANSDYHARLKYAVLGRPVDAARLPAPPQPQSPAAPVLRPGGEAEAGLKPGTVARIAAACRSWAEEGRVPFVTLVARRGVVVYHEALGTNAFGPYTLETACPVASITKAVTATLVARYVDQGLLKLDEPVGKYLPDFPVTGPKAITLRHALSHTTGYEGNQGWGGVDQPWFDNSASLLLPFLNPGQAFLYNGKGFSLTGKVLELAGALSVESQFRRCLFEPLGIVHARVGDLGGSGQFRAGELAVLAQLWLNRGAYGALRYFSETTWKALLPSDLSNHFPAVRNAEYGIGLSPMRLTNRESTATRPWLLSPQTYGHGSATASIFRIDPENEVIAVQVRNTKGDPKVYDRHLEAFLRAIDEGLPR
ncbi:MAG: beta-lactamase family protein [Spirochaetes bacterium]|nr:beta-lactamase family protein [Spirochaetota bacterium]